MTLRILMDSLRNTKFTLISVFLWEILSFPSIINSSAVKPSCAIVPVCTSFLLVLRQSTALYSLLSSCFKTVFGKAKESNYEHKTSHIGCSRCEHNSILKLYPGTGSRVTSVDSPLVYFHGYKHFTFEWYKV